MRYEHEEDTYYNDTMNVPRLRLVRTLSSEELKHQQDAERAWKRVHRRARLRSWWQTDAGMNTIAIVLATIVICFFAFVMLPFINS
jgi:hypothetical protein